MKARTFIDLFCGCGGFSLGMERAGFKCLAAVDFNPEAMAVFRNNFPHVPHALREDLTQFPPEKLSALLREALNPQLPNSQLAVDVIVGVPQKRERQLFIGTRLDLPDYFVSRLHRASPRSTTWRHSPSVLAREEPARRAVLESSRVQQ